MGKLLKVTGHPKYYGWGDNHTLYDYLRWNHGSENFAELWFGTHPKGQAHVANGIPLLTLVSHQTDFLKPKAHTPREYLGLSYLVKFIAPSKPLSVQVHPSKTAAASGYAKEEQAGLPLNDPTRLFKDRNHKPELLLALSDWEALVGIDAQASICGFLEALDTRHARSALGNIIEQGVGPYLHNLLTGRNHVSQYAIAETVARCGELAQEATNPQIRNRAELLLRLHSFFPNDPGLLLALMMNHVKLQPGEAIFVPVGTPHAYLSGIGFEVMAASDNVLRAGLTTKHVDAHELAACADFNPVNPQILQPQISKLKQLTIQQFKVPVPDFQVAVYILEGGSQALKNTLNELLVCLSGEIKIDTHVQKLHLQQGEVAFLTENSQVIVSGNGRLAHVQGMKVAK